MSEYTIELLRRPFSGLRHSDPEIAEFADKGEAINRAKELYRANEARSSGWRVLNLSGQLVGIEIHSA